MATRLGPPCSQCCGVFKVAFVASLLFRSALCQIRGSLERCDDNLGVNWTEVHGTINAYISTEKRVDSNFGWVQALAVRGAPNPDSGQSDCWHGWIALRFFALVIFASDREAFLREQAFDFEYGFWLSSDWTELVKSRWNTFEVWHAASGSIQQMCRNGNLQFESMCSSSERRLLDHIRRAAHEAGHGDFLSQVAPVAAELLASSATPAFMSKAYLGVCSAHARAVAVMILGLSQQSIFRVTPGYALRAAQGALQASQENYKFLLNSPWPVAPILANLVSERKEAEARPDASAEDELAEAVVRASRLEFPSVPPSFLPPASRLERLRLLEALQVAHRVLGVARIAYIVMTGTLLGAMRHHGFVPWDGDADICLDIHDEPRLLQLALSQRGSIAADAALATSSPLMLAATVLNDAGFELYAHAERPLTYKLSGRSFPRVPGRPYGYPYLDLWFCHGWSEGTFSMQSEHFGVHIPREYVFPRRRVFFAGLSLWSFGDPQGALSSYYGDDWFDTCVGHMTFHRQERKFSEETESNRFDGRMPCKDLSHLFGFASASSSGMPSEVQEDVLMERLTAWFSAAGRPSWLPSLDDGARAAQAAEAEGHPEPIRFRGEGRLLPMEVINASTSTLTGPGNRLVHILVDVSLSTRDVGDATSDVRCDLLLRLTPLGLLAGELDTQLLGAFPQAEQLTPLVGNDESAWRLVVHSYMCTRSFGSLTLEWTAGHA